MFDYDYCILGAGPSGLTAAYRLLQAGKRVLLIERDAQVGGLAKSHCYEGHIFDTGPKRFHTNDEQVVSFIQEIIGHDIVQISRSTKVHFLNRYFNWPLTTADIFKLPAGVAFKCFCELSSKKSMRDKTSFHEYIRVRYGEELYRTFFKPYTQKFLRWEPEDIHSDWASTGINRTVIDNRYDANSLMSIFKSLLLPKKIDTQFLYPASGGFGGFYEQLIRLCRSYPGFHVSLKDTVISTKKIPHGLELSTLSGRRVTCGDLIWTGNLNHLLKTIDQNGHVHYLNTVFYNLICRENIVLRKGTQWIYVSRGDSLISRITCMREFAPYTSPAGYYNLICELTDSQTDPKYMNDTARYVPGIIDELKTISFIKRNASPEAVHINPVMDTYPIYHKNYHKDFGLAVADVKKFSKHIHLLGRSGAFWYNNSDHSIRFALEMAKRLLAGDERPFDYRHYFGGTSLKVSNHQGK